MKVKFCPSCGSKKIEIVKEGKFPGMPYFPYGSPLCYRCMKCGFTSFIFPEKGSIKDETNNSSV